MNRNLMISGAFAAAIAAVVIGFAAFGAHSSDAQSPVTATATAGVQLTQVRARAIAAEAAGQELGRIADTLGRPIATVGSKAISFDDLSESGHMMAEPGKVSRSAAVSFEGLAFTGRPEQGALWAFSFERPDVQLTDPDAPEGPHKLVVIVIVADTSARAVDVNVTAY